MESPSSSTQASSPDTGSVLCDKCRNSVVEPDRNASNLPITDRLRQVAREWKLSPRMWPVGYIIESSYSPFRVEQELPKRDWRNAFEDLLALESGGEMISHESREEERAAAARLNWERAAFCIGKLNKLNERDSVGNALAQQFRSLAEQKGNQRHVSWIDEKIKGMRELVQLRVALAQEFKDVDEVRRDWSASRRKARGQWMASLITSGALTGWQSALEDSTDGYHYSLAKRGGETPEEDQDGMRFTEVEVRELYEQGKPLEWGSPGPPLYEISSRGPKVENDTYLHEDDTAQPLSDEAPPDEPPPDEPILMSLTPDRPYFRTQQTSAERITLPNGKMATKVTLRNILTNDEVEEKVIVQEPGMVLQEVEKARALIQDRVFGFDQPI